MLLKTYENSYVALLGISKKLDSSAYKDMCAKNFIFLWALSENERKLNSQRYLVQPRTIYTQRLFVIMTSSSR